MGIIFSVIYLYILSNELGLIAWIRIRKLSFNFQIEKTKPVKEPGSCEEHASLVKHSDTNGTNVWISIPPENKPQA